MRDIKILWADDEIDLLKIHILFLEEKGYKVVTANNGDDAIEMVQNESFDIIFLDENMPGLSGLETLSHIKNVRPNVPIIMITKSEEEDIMDQAIGSKISDYLIKPVNPNQILLAIKKNVDTKRLIRQKTTADYQSEFGKLGVQMNEAQTFDDWVDVYKKLVYWELELDKSSDSMMDEILIMQKSDADISFSKFIKNNYLSWFDPKNDDSPLMSPSIFRNKVYPYLKKGEKVFLIVIDNLRLDQWKTIYPIFQDYVSIEEEQVYCSILPTATQFARNAIFSGLMPAEIEKHFPELWISEIDEGGKNEFEPELLKKQLTRLGLEIDFTYEKVNNQKGGKKVIDSLPHLLKKQLNVVVYNFIDMLSHSRTEMAMMRELAKDESAYRSLTASWVKHSSVLELMKELSDKNVKIVLTTDHGTIRVNNPTKVIGDRKTTTNLRYKQGKNLNYNKKEVFEITQPEKAHLPTSNLSSTYIFAGKDDFFAYPNNYNHYVKYYKNTFQHGGISMEEMLIPVISLRPKK